MELCNVGRLRLGLGLGFANVFRLSLSPLRPANQAIFDPADCVTPQGDQSTRKFCEAS